MICKECAWDADLQSAHIAAVEKYFPVLVAKVSPEPGSGHDGCEGCDCAHYPVGHGQVKNED